MKRSVTLAIIIFVALVVVIGFFIYVGAWRPFSYSNEWKFEKIIINTGEYYNQNPDVIQLRDGCFRMYTHGWRKGVNENNIYSFYSCDGLDWKFEGMRIESASMPAATVLDDGKIRLYFGRGVEDGRQALMIAISDEGLNFTVYGKPLLTTREGEWKDIKTTAHYELVKLDKGYRIYFDEGGIKAGELPQNYKTGWLWPVVRIRSIYSKDGFNWTLEPGIRIDYEQAPMKYMERAGTSTVIKLDDGWHMFFSAGFSPWEDWSWRPWARWEWGGIYEAVSEDGLNFIIIDKRVSEGGDAKVIKIGNKLRMYLSNNPWWSRSRIYRRLFSETPNYVYTKVKELK